MTVTLGGFAFQDLEIPESISWGGPRWGSIWVPPVAFS